MRRRHGRRHAPSPTAPGRPALISRPAVVAALLGVFTVVLGLAWGTWVAGGSDSYCYLNQAELLASGRVHDPQPLAARVPWPLAIWTFTPVGHLPVPGREDAIVPMCATGYPIAMAGARLLGGRTAMFLVVPLFGGLAVWVAFLLGRCLGGPAAGLLAAAVLAASPAFLHQLMQPMTDVPAAALWALALLFGVRHADGPMNGRAAVLSGLASGAALMVRPNLLPLAAVAAAAVLLARPLTWRDAVGGVILFALGTAPFILGILGMNTLMYGGPLTSGYGSIGPLFSLSHVWPNLERYPAWLVETQTPAIALALAAPFLLAGARTRAAWWLLAFFFATFGSYVAYSVYDGWWFLRFLLPAFPALAVLVSLALVALVGRLPAGWRHAALGAAAAVLVALEVGSAIDGEVFRRRDTERMYRDAGEYVAARLPPDAIVLADTLAGAIRFYSGRPTLLWPSLEPDWLDRALAFLEAEGYRPYLLFEAHDVAAFRDRFGAGSPIGQLEWPPTAEIDRAMRIYDPADRARYLNGERIVTDVVWTGRRR